MSMLSCLAGLVPRRRFDFGSPAQAISEPDERYEAYCASSDFIREHIFPGGHLPSMGAMLDAARGTSLSVQVLHQGPSRKEV